MLRKTRPSRRPCTRRDMLLVLLQALLLSATLAPGAALAATQEDHTQFSVIAGSLSFSTVPGLPALSSVTSRPSADHQHNDDQLRRGRRHRQRLGLERHGRRTVGTGKSAVFAQYCPKAKCGSENEGYVPSGRRSRPTR